MRLGFEIEKIVKPVLMSAAIVLNDILEFIAYDDMDVMSKRARRILSNKEDAKLYIEAIRKIRDGSEEETITISTGEKITLI